MDKNLARIDIRDMLVWGDIDVDSRNIIHDLKIDRLQFYDGEDIRSFVGHEIPDLILLSVNDINSAVYQVIQLTDYFDSSSIICLLGDRDIESITRLLACGANEIITTSSLNPDYFHRICQQALARQSFVNQRLEGFQFDPLTGIANRLMFNSHLATVLHRAQRFHCWVSVIFLDLDRFKSVNDTMGHKVGDQLLIEVARRLASAIRTSDMVARISGDEFALIIDNMTHAGDAEFVAKKILTLFEQPFTILSTRMSIGASLGIANFPDIATDAESLVEYADMAMYQAKKAGRNCFVTYHHGEEQTQSEDIELQLKRALAANEFTLYYQPKFELASSKIIGAEALLRWTNNKIGVVAPAQFIPVAERLGIMVPISEWIVREVCKNTSEWREQGLPDVPISINIGGREIRTEGFADGIQKVLDESGQKSTLLELEITEKVLIELESQDASLLDNLKAMGLKIAVDDFGGDSVSLTMLKNNLIDTLKIDPIVTQMIANNTNDAAISESIIDLARKLKLNVIAEGVESLGQLDKLKQQGCNAVQGYVYSPAITADEFARMLAQYQDDPAFSVKPSD